MQFNSRRSPALATHGMVATSQPLAAMAGLQMLMKGGNAVDGAVAAAAALNVVEPMSTGIGGDLFALVWNADDKSIRALNASGRAPAAANLEELHSQGYTYIPTLSPYAVTVPGCVDGWHTLIEECGAMSLSEVLAPAIQYAMTGYPVSPIIAAAFAAGLAKLTRYPSGSELLLDGRAPRTGEVLRLPELGRSLETVAEGGRDAFYLGESARRISAYVQERGGWLAEEDFASHVSTWDEPISTTYRDVTCWECPPNGQGINALMALNIAEGFDLPGMGFQSVATYHHLIESMRLAFADGFRYVADPRRVDVPVGGMLSKERAEETPCPDITGPRHGGSALRFQPGRLRYCLRHLRRRTRQWLLPDQQPISRLRYGAGSSRYRHRPTEPRKQLFPRPRSSQRPGAGEATLPYDHSRPGHSRRRTLAQLRGNGRLPTGPGASAGYGKHGGLRSRPARGSRRA